MPIPDAIRPSGAQHMDAPGVEGATVIDNIQDRIDYANGVAEGAVPVTLVDAKGDLIVGDAPDGLDRLGVGTDGQVLTANAMQPLGMHWVTPSGGGGGGVTDHGALTGLADDDHPHYLTEARGNALYPTIAWTSSGLAGKAPTAHTHSGADITDDTITAAKIAANAVGSSELADNAVDTAAIADSAVTFVKIAPGAIGTTGSTVAAGNHSHTAAYSGSETFGVSGAVTTRTGAQRIYNDSGRTRTIVAVRASAGTAPTGASLICDVNKGGTTIFGTQSARPTIAVSTNTNKTTGHTVTTWADGEYLTVDVDQIGSTVAGSDLSVTIEWS